MKNALGVSLGICAAVYTFLVLGVISVIGAAAILGGFIAWGSYFTVGKDALSKNISANVFGAVLAGVAVLLYGQINAYVGAEVMVDSEEGPQRGILCEIGDLWAQVQSNR